MNLAEIVKHSILGTAIFTVADSQFESKIQASSMSDEEKMKMRGAAGGAVGGAIIGYCVGEKLTPAGELYDLKDKLVSAATGALAGGLGGYLLGRHIYNTKSCKP